MNPFARLNGHTETTSWAIADLEPTPAAEWQRMRTFLAITGPEMEAMLATVEVLFRRGHELVVGTYDYLLHNEETAAILGWERGADETHLAERRRFFTVWLARLLGFDFSDDLANYLFRAGRLHAGHGPRRAHVPPVFVTGSVSMVNAAFARFLAEEMPGHGAIPQALAGWGKVLNLHLHLMLMGYHAAAAIDQGPTPVRVTFFGKMRTITGVHDLTMRVDDGAAMEQLLRKLFNYFPQARSHVFDLEWTDGQRIDARGTPWFQAQPVYRVKPMWRVLINGRDIGYAGGPGIKVNPGDEVHLFPPGR